MKCIFQRTLLIFYCVCPCAYFVVSVNAASIYKTPSLTHRPEGNILIALEKYHIVGKERTRFYSELLELYVWDKNDEQPYLEELAKEDPSITSLKLRDGRQVMVMAIFNDYVIYNFVFMDINKKMSYIGMINGSAKYMALENVLIEGPQAILLFVANQTDSGTGIASYEYKVSQIGEREIKTLGGIPFKGYMSGWSALYNLDYSSKMIDVKRGYVNELRFIVKFKFEMDYFRGCDKYYPNNYPEGKTRELFNDELIYIYDLNKFDLKSKNSNSVIAKHRASATTLLKYPDFLVFHFAKLKEMAKKGNNLQKCWLKQLLKEKDVLNMKETKYREELTRILNK